MVQFSPGASPSSGTPPMDFWSEIDPTFTITATATNRNLPSVTVDLPPGPSIQRVVAMLKFAIKQDSSGSSNSLVLAGTEHIQVKDGGTYTDAIKLIAGMAQVAGNGRDGGDAWIGDIDIKSVVDEDDTYEFQWEGSDCTADSLTFRDLQVGLRIYFN